MNGEAINERPQVRHACASQRKGEILGLAKVCQARKDWWNCPVWEAVAIGMAVTDYSINPNDLADRFRDLVCSVGGIPDETEPPPAPGRGSGRGVVPFGPGEIYDLSHEGIANVLEAVGFTLTNADDRHSAISAAARDILESHGIDQEQLSRAFDDLARKVRLL